MKKCLVVAAAVMIAAVLAACGNATIDPAGGSDDLRIVTTVFPEYDWVMNILGDNPAKADVSLLLDNGVDIHSYQPTAEDILNISGADIFVYVGGESDAWVADALKGAVNKDMIVIDLLDVLGDSAKEEENVEGMQEEEEEHEHDDEGPEYDEHVWLSLRNAQIFAKSIADALKSVDPDHAKVYEDNLRSYTDKLKDLDARYTDVVSKAPVKTLLFGDRFPFRYMTDDYGLSYYAAFAGCSAETEASFETVTFLAEKVDELSLPAVMTIEGGDHRIAETIVANTRSKDQKILTLDSMQATTAEDIQNGTTYLSVMEKDLSVLEEALK